MRVPNYRNVTVNSTGILTANPWNSYTGGLIVFRASGTVSGSGFIYANLLGYRGGTDANGEGYGGGTQGAIGHSNDSAYGGGGGYATAGAGRTDSGTGTGAGGASYGDPQLNTLFLGSGGGAGGDWTGHTGKPGGTGGGIVFIAGQTINFTGYLTAEGGPDSGGWTPGGGGAGGSIRIEGNTINLNTADVAADGNNPTLPGGDGGSPGSQGRIAVYYQSSFSGNFTPGYLQKGSLADIILQDGFESGDLSKWSSSATDGGNLSATPASSYLGTYGLQAIIPSGDANSKYVMDSLPSSMDSYHTRFYVNPMGVTITNGMINLFSGFYNTVAFVVELEELSGGNYSIRARLINNSNVWSYTNWYPISDGWNAIETDYEVGTSGSLTLYLNGASQQTLGNVDNSLWAINEALLGVGIPTGSTASGTLYFDSFESRRFSVIGMLLPPDLPPAQVAVQAGWVGNDYAYDPNHPHAASTVTNDSSHSPVGGYTYDADGNMTCRTETQNGTTNIYNQVYNSENRLSVVQALSAGTSCPTADTLASTNITTQWNFSYDGDGNRVAQAYVPYSSGNPGTPVFTEYFMGGAYEVSGSSVKKYYSIAGMTIAMNDWCGANGLKYLLTDQLGSVVAITNSTGTLISQQRYLPFGQVRTDVASPNAPATDFAFTGQRNLDAQGNASLGLDGLSCSHVRSFASEIHSAGYNHSK